MTHRESKVETYIDTLSSGDSNNMKSKQQTKEVNNNEVDELSKELSEMGCIVDAIKRPPNICVESCVYESDSEKSEQSQIYDENEEDGYSDEFEEDKSGNEEDSVKTSPKYEECVCRNQSAIKISKSLASMCSNTKSPGSVSGRSGRSDFGGVLQGGQSVLASPVTASMECPRVGPPITSANAVPPQKHVHFKGPSLSAGGIVLVKLTSVSVPHTRRINMSFSNERLREIERHNHILLTKILSARNSRKSTIPPREQSMKKAVPSAAVSRKNQQRQIDHDNMILLKKIQRAKSSALSIRR